MTRPFFEFQRGLGLSLSVGVETYFTQIFSVCREGGTDTKHQDLTPVWSEVFTTWKVEIERCRFIDRF